jgi:hypothetical protein
MMVTELLRIAYETFLDGISEAQLLATAALGAGHFRGERR